MTRPVHVAGVAMTRFRKPAEGVPYTELGAEAVRDALADAGVDYNQVEQAFCAFMYADSAAGQRVLYHVGKTGIPIVNLHNQCAGGSTALALARMAVASGAAECALALGFEQLAPGMSALVFEDRPGPVDLHMVIAESRTAHSDQPLPIRLFASAAIEYRERYGLAGETLARIAVKNRSHAAGNPNAVFRSAIGVEDVLASPLLLDPLTKLQCCPPSSGAAAAVVCSEEFARKVGATSRAVRIAGQAMVSDTNDTFDGNSPISMVGSAMTRAAARRACETAGIGIDEVDAIELHDCFTINELITYEGLGLAEEGEGAKLVQDRDTTYGGCWVVNPSGGLLSKGHPISATGLGQCAELVSQLRGEAGARQVEGARVALQHNLGLGGACVVTIYQA